MPRQPYLIGMHDFKYENFAVYARPGHAIRRIRQVRAKASLIQILPVFLLVVLMCSL